MPDTLMSCSFGEFKLLRFPLEKSLKLRAWDAADEYLLNDITLKLKAYSAPKILIVNDSFGALSVALAQFKPCMMSDSFIAQQATQHNLALNNIEGVTFYDSLQKFEQPFDFILIKAPKTLAFLEDSLARIQSALGVKTQLILAGMIKNMSPSVWQMLDKYIGTTAPSKAIKKARLIYTQVDLETRPLANLLPYYYRLENTDYMLCNYANVFSRQKLDIGTRFFLQYLPIGTHYKQVVDLGCGNGVLGLMCATQNPEAELHFIDESFMAVASAKDNFKRGLPNRKAYFSVSDSLTDIANNSIDLVLCNPPFHQQHTIGDYIAERMFKQSKKVLREQGELWVIGNRHLGYQASLKRLFNQVDLVAENAKFVIIKAATLS